MVPTLLALTYILALTGSRDELGVPARAHCAVGSVPGAGAYRSATAGCWLFSAWSLVALVVLPWLMSCWHRTQPESTPTASVAPGLRRCLRRRSARASGRRPGDVRAARRCSASACVDSAGITSCSTPSSRAARGRLHRPRAQPAAARAGRVGLGRLARAGCDFACSGSVGLLRQPRTAAHWWMWAAALVLAVHSMLEYPLWYTFFLGFAAVVLGMGEARTIKLPVPAGRAAAGGCCSRCWRSAGW